MKLNSLNLNIANNRGNQFQQPGSLAPVGQTGQSQSRPGDRTGLSREAQQAAGAQGMRGGSAQQLTQALSRDIGQVLQAQGSGDQNRSQQALQQLGQTYQQGQQSGQLQQVPPMVRQTAESLLGINQQGQGQAQPQAHAQPHPQPQPRAQAARWKRLTTRFHPRGTAANRT